MRAADHDLPHFTLGQLLWGRRAEQGWGCFPSVPAQSLLHRRDPLAARNLWLPVENPVRGSSHHSADDEEGRPDCGESRSVPVLEGVPQEFVSVCLSVFSESLPIAALLLCCWGTRPGRALLQLLRGGALRAGRARPLSGRKRLCQQRGCKRGL